MNNCFNMMLESCEGCTNVPGQPGILIVHTFYYMKKNIRKDTQPWND